LKIVRIKEVREALCVCVYRSESRQVPSKDEESWR
jgi:hypothetical protein